MKILGHLIVIKRSGVDGTPYPLTTNNTSCSIGRGLECDIRVQLPHVSVQHCRIEVETSGKAYVTNWSSTNPTCLNGVELSHNEIQFLSHKDVIRVADRQLRWEYPEGSVFCIISAAKENDFKILTPNCKAPVGVNANSHNDKNSTISIEEQQIAEAKRKKVSFGRQLDPEHFDKKLPPSTPVRKGEKPDTFASPLLPGTRRRVSAIPLTPSIIEEVAVETPTKSLLRRRSPTPIKPYLARSLKILSPKPLVAEFASNQENGSGSSQEGNTPRSSPNNSNISSEAVSPDHSLLPFQSPEMVFEEPNKTPVAHITKSPVLKTPSRTNASTPMSSRGSTLSMKDTSPVNLKDVTPVVDKDKRLSLRVTRAPSSMKDSRRRSESVLTSEPAKDLQRPRRSLSADVAISVVTPKVLRKSSSKNSPSQTPRDYLPEESSVVSQDEAESDTESEAVDLPESSKSMLAEIEESLGDVSAYEPSVLGTPQVRAASNAARYELDDTLDIVSAATPISSKKSLKKDDFELEQNRCSPRKLDFGRRASSVSKTPVSSPKKRLLSATPKSIKILSPAYDSPKESVAILGMQETACEVTPFKNDDSAITPPPMSVKPSPKSEKPRRTLKPVSAKVVREKTPSRTLSYASAVKKGQKRKASLTPSPSRKKIKATVKTPSTGKKVLPPTSGHKVSLKSVGKTPTSSHKLPPKSVGKTPTSSRKVAPKSVGKTPKKSWADILKRGLMAHGIPASKAQEASIVMNKARLHRQNRKQAPEQEVPLPTFSQSIPKNFNFAQSTGHCNSPAPILIHKRTSAKTPKVFRKGRKAPMKPEMKMEDINEIDLEGLAELLDTPKGKKKNEDVVQKATGWTLPEIVSHFTPLSKAVKLKEAFARSANAGSPKTPKSCVSSLTSETGSPKSCVSSLTSETGSPKSLDETNMSSLHFSPITPPDMNTSRRTRSTSVSNTPISNTNITNFDFSAIKTPDVSEGNFVSPLVTPAITAKTPERLLRSTQKSIAEDSLITLDTDATTFDFDDVRTPNVSRDLFVSPMSTRSKLATPKVSKLSAVVEDGFQPADYDQATLPSSESPRDSTIEVVNSPRVGQQCLGNVDSKLTASDLVDDAVQSESDVTSKSMISLEDSLSSTSKSGRKSLRKSSRTPRNDGNATPTLKADDMNDLVVKRILRTPKDTPVTKEVNTDTLEVKRLSQTPKENAESDIAEMKQLMRVRTPNVNVESTSISNSGGLSDLSEKEEISETDHKSGETILCEPRVTRKSMVSLQDSLCSTPKSDHKSARKSNRTPCNNGIATPTLKVDMNDLVVKRILRTPKDSPAGKQHNTEVLEDQSVSQTPTSKRVESDNAGVTEMKQLMRVRTPNVNVESPSISNSRLSEDLSNEKIDEPCYKADDTPRVTRRSMISQDVSLCSTPKSVRKSNIIPGNNVIATPTPVADDVNVQSVEQILRTPKETHAGEQDVTEDLKIKRLSRTPKSRSAESNDANIAEMKQLTPKAVDLEKEMGDSDVSGQVKTLGTPKAPVESPKVDYSDDAEIHGTPKSMKDIETPKPLMSKNEPGITDVSGIKRLLRTPKPAIESPGTDYSDVRGVKKVMKTPKPAAPEQEPDYTNGVGIKKLVQTPKAPPSSPVADYTNTYGVKKLMSTPREEPQEREADYSHIRGVRKVLRTPKPAVESPKADYTQVAGMKNLMTTPREEPQEREADYSHISGVRKVLRTPKPAVESPKADYTQVAGMKKLLSSPTAAAPEPEGDYTNVAGIKKLLGTPQNSEESQPACDYTDVHGLKKLLKTPHGKQEDQANYSSPRGLKKLMGTPKKTIIEPLSDYTNVGGIKKLLRTPNTNTQTKSPKSDYTLVHGVRDLMRTPKTIVTNALEVDMDGMSPLFKTPLADNTNVVEQVLDLVKETSSPLRKSSRSKAFVESDSPSENVPPESDLKTVVNLMKEENSRMATSPRRSRRNEKTEVLNVEVDQSDSKASKRTRATRGKAAAKEQVPEEKVAENETPVKKQAGRGKRKMALEETSVQEEIGKDVMSEVSAAPVLMEEPKVDQEVLTEEPKVDQEVLTEEPKVDQEVLTEEPKVDQEVLTEEPKVDQEVLTEEPKVDQEVMMEEPKVDQEVMMEEPKVDQEVMMEEPKVDKKPTPARSTRGRRVKFELPPTPQEVDISSPVRGRRKRNIKEDDTAAPPVRSKRGKNSVPEIVVEEPTSVTDTKSSTNPSENMKESQPIIKDVAKAGKKAEAEKDIPVGTNTEENEQVATPVKKGRARGRATKKTEKAKVEEMEDSKTSPEVVQENSESNEDTVEDHVQTAAAVKRGRPRGRVAKKIENAKVEEKENMPVPDVEDNVQNATPVKKSRARGRVTKKTENAKVEEIEDSKSSPELVKETNRDAQDIVEEHVQTATPVKKGRGRRTQKAEISQSPSKDIPKNNENDLEKTKAQPSRTRRTRGAPAVNYGEQSPSVEDKKVANRRGRTRKPASPLVSGESKEEESVQSNLENVIPESPTPVPKRGQRKNIKDQKAPLKEIQNEDPGLEESKPEKSTRGRRGQSKTLPKKDEPQEEEIVEKKAIRSRQGRNATKRGHADDEQEEEIPKKAARQTGRRKAAADDKSEIVATNDLESDKNSSDSSSDKVTRGGRSKRGAKAAEAEEKENIPATKRTRKCKTIEQPEPEPEERPTRRTRARK